MLKSSLLCLALVYAVYADHGSVAPTYTAEEFAAEVAKKPHFVMFFAPWCGHCKNLAPTWDELAGKWNAKDYPEATIAKVDCTTETQLCSEQSVSGYPTLKFFNKKAEEGERYKGPRDLTNLEGFMKGLLGMDTKEDGDAKEGGEAPEPEVVDGLAILTADNFDKFVKKGYSFVKFYAPWCGHCKRLVPAWDELAKAYEKDESVTIGKVDCTEHRALCGTYSVQGYPTLLFFVDGEKVEKYAGARESQGLRDFVASMKSKPHNVGKDSTAEKIPDAKEAAAAPAAAEGNVLDLSEKTFKDTIASGVTFVKFFAPWCGHCKRLAPTWIELGDKYAPNSNVKIAKVDCTVERELCGEYGVRGYPTLKVFIDGKADDYNGGRDLGALSSFIDGKVPKDEL